MLRWSGGIMLALGCGHLVLSVVLAGDGMAGWLDRGPWAAVPLMPGDAAADLRNALVFWAAPGSFAVPLALLGALVVHLAGRGVAVPAAFGWALAAWCLLGAVLLVPSPFAVGAVAGLLVVLAHRRTSGKELP